LEGVQKASAVHNLSLEDACPHLLPLRHARPPTRMSYTYPFPLPDHEAERLLSLAESAAIAAPPTCRSHFASIYIGPRRRATLKSSCWTLRAGFDDIVCVCATVTGCPISVVGAIF